MFKRIETVAWMVLFAALTICLTLALGTPLAIRGYVLHNTRPLIINLHPRSGTVTRQEPGSATAVLVTQVTEIQPNRRIHLTDSGDDALLLFYHPDEPDLPIVTVQLYGRTEVIVDRARTPRFDASKLPHYVELDIRRGANTRITVEGDARAATLRLQTPHGAIDLTEGTYSVTVERQQTLFNVSAGQAYVPSPTTGEMLVLTNLQRVELTEAGIGEITVGARDILRNRNGNFQENLTNYWQIYTKTAFDDESGGTVHQTETSDNQRIVNFTRVGREHAETGIIQELNMDIRGAKSLRVQARIRVDAQTIGVCGSLGTECPIMLRLEFTDLDSNAPREWLQGFYSIDGTDGAFCQICQWRVQHYQVPLSVWYDYESPDLLPLLREQDIEPSSLVSIKVYASGHTYRSAIDDLAILIGE